MWAFSCSSHIQRCIVTYLNYFKFSGDCLLGTQQVQVTSVWSLELSYEADDVLILVCGERNQRIKKFIDFITPRILIWQPSIPHHTKHSSPFWNGSRMVHLWFLESKVMPCTKQVHWYLIINVYTCVPFEAVLISREDTKCLKLWVLTTDFNKVHLSIHTCNMNFYFLMGSLANTKRNQYILIVIPQK